MQKDHIRNQGLDIVRDFQFVKQVSAQSLGQLTYAYLKSKIMRGDISDDQRLGEGDLVKTLGVSRTPIRHALERLEQESFIRKLSYGGYEIKRLTRRDINEIFGVRSVMESYAASLAAKQMTRATLKKLEQIIERSRVAFEKDDVDEAVELNTKFHDSLYRASGSEQLYHIIQNIGDYLYRYRKVILLQKSNREESIRDHETMIRAIVEGKHDSVEGLVKEHVLKALKVVLKELHKGK